MDKQWETWGSRREDPWIVGDFGSGGFWTDEQSKGQEKGKEERKDSIWETSPLATLSIISKRTIGIGSPRLFCAHLFECFQIKNSSPKNRYGQH